MNSFETGSSFQTHSVMEQQLLKMNSFDTGSSFQTLSKWVPFKLYSHQRMNFVLIGQKRSIRSREMFTAAKVGRNKTVVNRAVLSSKNEIC